MVEVPVFVGCDRLSLGRLGHVGGVHGDGIQSSVTLSGYEEAIGDHDGAALVVEDVIRDDLNIVGPLEGTNVLDLCGLKFGDGVVCDSILNSSSDPDGPVSDRASGE